ncbi:MAG: cyclase family protein [Oscillospiraceae bacterium]
MKLHDLSQLLSPQTPVYPGDPPFAFTQKLTLPADVCAVSKFTAGTHFGTHIDAFAHFIDGGLTAEAMPLAQFVGRALVAAITPENGAISVTALERALSHRTDERILLLSTGHGRAAGTAAFFQNLPLLPDGLAALLTKSGIITLGLDCPSVESAAGTVALHKSLLGSGIALVEGLVGLENLVGKVPRSVFFSAAPLKIRGADGTPVRAYAMTED